MTQNSNTPVGVRKETNRSGVTLSRVYVNEFQKAKTKTAEIRETVTTKSFYPSAKVATTLQSGLASAEAFGFEAKEFESTEQRVAFVLVPENWTEAETAKTLAAQALNGACVYRALSNEPILDENQEYAINAGLKTKDDFAQSQLVRYPKGHPQEGQPILDGNKNVQYRRTFYWETPKEDVDLRGESGIYMPSDVEVEVMGAGVLSSQKI